MNRPFPLKHKESTTHVMLSIYDMSTTVRGSRFKENDVYRLQGIRKNFYFSVFAFPLLLFRFHFSVFRFFYLSLFR